MPDQNDIDRVWDIIESNSIGMLTTQFAGGLRARPVDRAPIATPGRSGLSPSARPQGRRDRGQAGRLLCCRRAGDNVYLSITGRASVRPRSRQGQGNLEEDRRRVVEGRAGRSERPRAEDRAGDGGAWDGPSSRWSRPTNSPRRESRAKSRISARTARKQCRWARALAPLGRASSAPLQGSLGSIAQSRLRLS